MSKATDDQALARAKRAIRSLQARVGALEKARRVELAMPLGVADTRPRNPLGQFAGGKARPSVAGMRRAYRGTPLNPVAKDFVRALLRDATATRNPTFR